MIKLRAVDWEKFSGGLYRWAPIAISLVALLISGWAAYVSRAAFLNEETYKELGILPILELRTDFKEGIKVIVTNKGAGQAIIEDFKIGKVSVSRYLYDTYGDHMLRVAQKCAKAAYPKYSSHVIFSPTTDRHSVRPGEEFEILSIAFKDESENTVKFSVDEAVTFFECRDDTNVQVCYCSISGRTCQAISGRRYLDGDFVCPPRKKSD